MSAALRGSMLTNAFTKDRFPCRNTILATPGDKINRAGSHNNLM